MLLGAVSFKRLSRSSLATDARHGPATEDGDSPATSRPPSAESILSFATGLCRSPLMARRESADNVGSERTSADSTSSTTTHTTSNSPILVQRALSRRAKGSKLSSLRQRGSSNNLKGDEAEGSSRGGSWDGCEEEEDGGAAKGFLAELDLLSLLAGDKEDEEDPLDELQAMLGIN